jgi:hypothetical protein
LQSQRRIEAGSGEQEAGFCHHGFTAQQWRREAAQLCDGPAVVRVVTAEKGYPGAGVEQHRHGSALPEARQVGRIGGQISRPSLTAAHQISHQITGGRGRRGLQPLGGLQKRREGTAHLLRLAEAASLGLLRELWVKGFGQLERDHRHGEETANPTNLVPIAWGYSVCFGPVSALARRDPVKTARRRP